MSMIQESEESGGASAAFEVRWENYGGSMARVLTELRQEEAFVDVTLASCDGGRFHAHRVVLSACSSYLRQVLHDLPLWQHPVLLLRDVPASDLEALLTFVYLGWVSVDRHQLPSFLRSARFLRIRGLAKMESSAENGIMMVDKENPCEGGTLDDTTDPTGNSNPCSPGTSTTDDLPNNRGKKRQHNTPKKGQGGSALEISSTLLVPQKADNKNKRVSPGGEALSYKNRKRSSTSTGLSSVTATISLIPRRAPQRNDEVPSEGKDATSPPQSSSAPMGPLCSLMVAATKVKQEAPDLDDIEDATEDGPDDLEPPQARRRRRSLVSSQSEQVVVPADPSLMMPGRGDQSPMDSDGGTDNVHTFGGDPSDDKSCVCPVCEAVLSNRNVLQYHLQYVHAITHQTRGHLFNSQQHQLAAAAAAVAAVAVATNPTKAPASSLASPPATTKTSIKQNQG